MTGFCWGGGIDERPRGRARRATCRRPRPFYGAAAPTAEVPKIKAALLIHYAEDDPRVNGMRPAYEEALKAAGASYEMFVYPGTMHGFHNNSTPRYKPEAAKLAWERTIALFKKHLA